MTDLPPELLRALEERDRSRRALSEPPTPMRTVGAKRRRSKTKAQKAARRRNR